MYLFLDPSNLQKWVNSTNFFAICIYPNVRIYVQKHAITVVQLKRAVTIYRHSATHGWTTMGVKRVPLHTCVANRADIAPWRKQQWSQLRFNPNNALTNLPFVPNGTKIVTFAIFKQFVQ